MAVPMKAPQPRIPIKAVLGACAGSLVVSVAALIVALASSGKTPAAPVPRPAASAPAPDLQPLRAALKDLDERLQAMDKKPVPAAIVTQSDPLPMQDPRIEELSKKISELQSSLEALSRRVDRDPAPTADPGPRQEDPAPAPVPPTPNRRANSRYHFNGKEYASPEEMRKAMEDAGVPKERIEQLLRGARGRP